MQTLATRETEARPPSANTESRLSYSCDSVYVLLTYLAALTAVAVRWHGLSVQSLWWDEGYTLWISQFSPSEIWRGVATDTSPPLYYLVEHFWIRYFSASDAALRGMSAFFETLSLPIFYLLARRILMDKAAVALAMWFYALSAFQVEYAQEARFYGQLSFLFLVCVYSLIVFLEKRSVLAFCILTLSLTAAAYTHNMALFYLPGIAFLWLLYPSLQTIRQRIVDGVLCAFVVLLLYSPWISHLRSQTKAVSQSFWASRPTVGRLADTICTISGLSVGVLQPLVARVLHLPSLLSATILACILIAILLSLILGGLFHALPQNKKKSGALFSYAVAPILLAFFVSLHFSPVFINRVFIASSAILPILFSTPIAFQTKIPKQLFAIAALFVLMLTSISLLGFLRYSRKEDWRGMTNYVQKMHGNHRLLLFVPSFGQVLFDHYSNQSNAAFTPEDEDGLPETFDYTHPFLPSTMSYSDGAFVIPLQQAIQSGKYGEIDAIVSHASNRVRTRVLDNFAAHCATVYDAEFFELEVKRCMLQPAK